MDSSILSIVSVGETTIDEYVELKKEFIGGISLNFAVQSKRSEADRVSLISCIGKDDRLRVLEKLTTESVDASHVHVRSGRTARQKILLSSDGERIFPSGGYDAGVLNGWELRDPDLNFICEHNVLASAVFRQTEGLFHQVMNIPFQGWRVADFLDLGDYGGDMAMFREYLNLLKVAFVSGDVGSSRVDLQACKLEYSIVSPK